MSSATIMQLIIAVTYRLAYDPYGTPYLVGSRGTICTVARHSARRAEPAVHWPRTAEDLTLVLLAALVVRNSLGKYYA